MQLEVRKQDDVLVVSILEKRLDASIKDDFKEHMMNYISSGSEKIVLNMAEVDFIDSSGLGVMVAVLKEVGGADNLAICNVAEPAMRMFKVAGAHRVFSILEGEREAIAALA